MCSCATRSLARTSLMLAFELIPANVCRHLCTFELSGDMVATLTGDVTTQSTTSASALTSAMLSCSSPSDTPLMVYGGAALAPFAAAFEGERPVLELQA